MFRPLQINAINRSAYVLVTTVFLMIITTPTAISAGKGTNPNGKPFVEIAGQIIEVEGEVSNLKDQMDSLVARVDTIEERVFTRANQKTGSVGKRWMKAFSASWVPF